MLDRYHSAVVSGGLGFIGSALSERLLTQGTAVTIVDNKLSNVIDERDLLTRYRNARFVHAGIREYLETLDRTSRFDLFVHAASYVGAAGILPFAGTMAADMVGATFAVTQFCLRTNADLINISSSEIYGRSGVLSETDDLRIPPYFNARLEYALAKLTGEAIIANSGERGLRAISLRPFNVVGPRQSRAGGFVFPTFVQQALGALPITVFGDGTQRRSFIGVDDIVDFVMTTLRSPLPSGLAVNVGNPSNSVTISELAVAVRKQLVSESRIEHVDARSVYGPTYREAESIEKVCDITLAGTFGWSPKQNLSALIAETAAFYRERHDPRGTDARV